MELENAIKEESDGNVNDSSDSSESENDTTEQDEARIRELDKEISKNPYLYNSHLELIKKLKSLGDLGRLRDARHNMKKHFPLSEEIWLEWLRDEIPLVSSPEERRQVEDLFNFAVKDYVSAALWLEYVQFAIGGMGEEGGIENIRDIFERAVTAVGLHVAQGANIWEAYREFENAILAGLMPQPGAVTTKEQEDAFNTQHQKIASLFKRQLAVPLLDMEESFAEYKEWLGGEAAPEVEKAYARALETLTSVRPFEKALLSASAPRLAEYQAYLEYELSQNEPARIQCLFERALLDNCLFPDLWTQYTKYLDEKLKISSISLEVYDRALRNCPWSALLWRNYIFLLERSSQPFERVKGSMDKALMAGFTEATDYLQIWTVYCDYLRRRIDWSKEHEQDLETFRMTVARAADHLFENFGLDGDPEASLRQYWASIEARHCNNMEKARELWNQVMQEGYGSQATMWLNYYRLERTFGDVKRCRRILQRALNSVTDWLEVVTQAYIDFEREEGTLDDYEAACSKCQVQLARVNERKAKAAERETVLKDQKKAQRASKGQKKGEKVSEKGDTYAAPSRGETTPKLTGKWSASVTGAKPVHDASRKRKMADDKEAGDRFKIPAVHFGSSQPPEKKSRDEVDEHGVSIQHDSSRDNVTVFVSNLDYHVPVDRLQHVFEKCGEVTDVRIVKNYKGLSKGFGYVEFTDPNSVLGALKLDREPIDGRPVFVSRCEDRTSGMKTHQFKYATALEKNKLFVKNLPFSCNIEALETIFKEHGNLKDVRLVTYRSGASKGLAYVEFETEEMAAQAILKTDGLQIGDHKISVAISNPPQRRQPFGQQPFVPSLGGGKKETETHGKARTQVMLLPRAVKQPGVKIPQQPPSSIAAESTASGESQGKMSNDDFRKMLLK